MIGELLSKKYPSSEYALLREVSDAAGFSRSRSADYVIMNLWPSRGLHLSGVELKSGRTDWLRELKNPKKAENIFKYCDFFWLLTENDGVANLDEIPQTWGWMLVKGNKIVIQKDAPKLEPAPITRSFLAALLKRANDKTEWVHQSSIQQRLDEARESGMAIQQHSIHNAERDLKQLQHKVKEFEDASGIKLNSDRWSFQNNKRIGETVKYLLDKGTAEEIQKEFKRIESASKILYERVCGAVNLLNEQN